MEQFHAFSWIAQIVNWCDMVGCGPTKEKAFEDLHRKFEARRAGLPSLPRPGTRVPIEFDSSVQIREYERIARDFFSEILGKDYYGFLLKYNSSLWDLCGPVLDETIEYYYKKIHQKFGVDVSDIEDAKLIMIFRRIHDHQVENRLQASEAQEKQMKMKWEKYDPEWLAKLAEEQHPKMPWLPDALRQCRKYLIRSEAYYYFVSGKNANKPGAEWQFDYNILLYDPVEGGLVLDILKGRRVGGVEFLDRI